MSLKESRQNILHLLFIVIGVGLIVNIIASMITSLIPQVISQFFLFLLSILTLITLILWIMLLNIHIPLQNFESIPCDIIYNMNIGTMYYPISPTFLSLEFLTQEEDIKNRLRNLIKTKDGKVQVDIDFILYLQEYLILSFLSEFYTFNWAIYRYYESRIGRVSQSTRPLGKKIPPSVQLQYTDFKEIFKKNPLIKDILPAFLFQITLPKGTKMLSVNNIPLKRKIILDNKYCKITFTLIYEGWQRGLGLRKDLAIIRARIECEIFFNRWRIPQVDENLYHWAFDMQKYLDKEFSEWNRSMAVFLESKILC